MAKKYYCPVCGYESDEPIDVCPVCGAKMAVREEGETSWAAEHKVGIIDGVSEEIVNGLRENFQGECTEVGMYLAMEIKIGKGNEKVTPHIYEVRLVTE